METLTVDEINEKKAWLETRNAMKAELKELALKQREDKLLLHMPHSEIPGGAWKVQSRTRYRAANITARLVEYHQHRNTKDGGASHQYKD